MRAAPAAATRSASVASGRAYRRLAAIESWKRCTSWATTPMAAASPASVTSRTSCPSILMDPVVTSYRRRSNPARVDLPAPVCPTSAVIVPGSARNDTPRSTQSDGPSASPAAPSGSSDATDMVAGSG